MGRDEQTAQQVERLAEPVAAALGLEIVQVVFRREADGWVLRLLIDQPGGVTIADCQRLSRELGDLMDVEDPIDRPYRMEVSSPGLDRPLVRPADFVRFAGRRIQLRTSQPLAGRRNFTGVLVGGDAARIVLQVDGSQLEIERGLVTKANLVPEIEGFPSTKGA